MNFASRAEAFHRDTYVIHAKSAPDRAWLDSMKTKS
jgi:hypothetical protein